VWREKYGGRGGYGTGQATWYGRVKMKSHRPMTIVLDLSASALLLLAVLCRLFHFAMARYAGVFHGAGRAYNLAVSRALKWTRDSVSAA
jgi:hypothetical protein